LLSHDAKDTYTAILVTDTVAALSPLNCPLPLVHKYSQLPLTTSSPPYCPLSLLHQHSKLPLPTPSPLNYPLVHKHEAHQESERQREIQRENLRESERESGRKGERQGMRQNQKESQEPSSTIGCLEAHGCASRACTRRWCAPPCQPHPALLAPSAPAPLQDPAANTQRDGDATLAVETLPTQSKICAKSEMHHESTTHAKRETHDHQGRMMTNHCNTLLHTATHCDILQRETHHESTTRAQRETHDHQGRRMTQSLQCTATHSTTHCNTLQPTAAHDHQACMMTPATPCATLQHTHCSTLQHTATHMMMTPSPSAWFPLSLVSRNGKQVVVAGLQSAPLPFLGAPRNTNTLSYTHTHTHDASRMPHEEGSREGRGADAIHTHSHTHTLAHTEVRVKIDLTCGSLGKTWRPILDVPERDSARARAHAFCPYPPPRPLLPHSYPTPARGVVATAGGVQADGCGVSWSSVELGCHSVKTGRDSVEAGSHIVETGNQEVEGMMYTSSTSTRTVQTGRPEIKTRCHTVETGGRGVGATMHTLSTSTWTVPNTSRAALVCGTSEAPSAMAVCWQSTDAVTAAQVLTSGLAQYRHGGQIARGPGADGDGEEDDVVKAHQMCGMAGISGQQPLAL